MNSVERRVQSNGPLGAKTMLAILGIRSKIKSAEGASANVIKQRQSVGVRVLVLWRVRKRAPAPRAAIRVDEVKSKDQPEECNSRPRCYVAKTPARDPIGQHGISNN
jgi:hypothetical protein